MKKTTLKRVVPAVVCGTILVLQAAPRCAADPLGGPSAISVGGFWPNDTEEAENSGGSNQLDADLRYHIPVPNPLDVPARTVLDVGAEFGSSNGNHSLVVPITIGEDVALMNKRSPLSSNTAYVGAGVGAYILNESGLSEATRVGGYVGLGYNFVAPLFVEAKYQFVDHADGATVNVGIRF
ncbi:MAG: hypothetical protein ACLQVD_13265 [Capsulimonadaceae bacterium]